MLNASKRYLIDWIALALGLLIIAAVFAWTLAQEHRHIGEQEGDRLNVQSRVVDENLLRQLEGANQALLGLAERFPDLKSNGHPEALTRDLKLLTASSPGVSAMLAFDAAGTIVASSRDGLTGKNFKDRDYFAVPMRSADPARLYISPPFHTTTGAFVVVASRLVQRADGRFAGVVTASLDPEYFAVLLRSVQYASDMRMTLVHASGAVFLSLPAGAGADRSPLRAEDIAPASLSTVDGRLLATRRIAREQLRLNVPMIVTASRDLAAMYLPWREHAAQLLALLVVLTVGSAMALQINHRRRRAYLVVAAAVRRERQTGAERVELALRGADLGLWDWHVPSDVWVLNARERALIGLPADAAPPTSEQWQAMIHPDDRASFELSMQPHLRGDSETWECEHRLRRADGEWIWLSSRAVIVERDATGAPIRIVGTHLDISARHAAEAERARGEQRLALALEGSEQALFDWDLATNLMYHSAEAAALRGEPAIEATLTLEELRATAHPDDMPAVMTSTRNVLKGLTAVYSVEFRLRHRSGGWTWVRARGRVVERDAGGRALRLAGTYADINQRKLAESRLRYLAEFDSLTNLPNRGLFNDRLRQAMTRAARGRRMAVLFLDIDHFKRINDTHGHAVGDEVLQVYAARMRANVRRSDTVARLAGDEFTVILEDLQAPEDAGVMASKLVEALREPVFASGKRVDVTASIGVALCVPGEGDVAALLARADGALYEAKRRGRDGYFCAAHEHLLANVTFKPVA